MHPLRAGLRGHLVTALPDGGLVETTLDSDPENEPLTACHVFFRMLHPVLFVKHGQRTGVITSFTFHARRRWTCAPRECPP